MTTTERPAPTILTESIRDERQLDVRVHDPQLMTGEDGKQFRPDRLFAKWVNGVLVLCTYSGDRINKDGSRHLRGDRSYVGYMAKGRSERGEDGRWVHYTSTTLADDTPPWVRELVEQHTPKPQEAS
jgi:hypothetical protein